MKKVKKILAVTGASVLLLGAGAFAGAQLFPKEVVKEVPVEKVVTVEKEVPVEVVKEVKVTQLVDNGKLDMVLKEIYDNNGNVAYLTDDLEDDEISQIADRIVLVNDFKSLAVQEVRSNLFDELDGETFNLVTFDDKDMERLRINDDADEIVIEDIDFEDKDAELLVTGTFEQDNVKYKYEALVEFKDGEVDEISSITVDLA
ncbi:MAG TPA: hypothetical protein V6C58_25555 [Allocoleopsis sp.]